MSLFHMFVCVCVSLSLSPTNQVHRVCCETLRNGTPLNKVWYACALCCTRFEHCSRVGGVVVEGVRWDVWLWWWLLIAGGRGGDGCSEG
jgi:hypothetical protein